MNILKAIKEKFFSARDQVVRLVDRGFHSLNLLDGFSFSKGNTNEFLSDGYGTNPFIYMVVDRISDVLSGLKRVVVDSEGNQVNLPQTAIELFEQPNPDSTSGDFYHKVASNILITGNCFIKKTASIGFGTVQLEVLYTPYVDIITENGQLDAEISHYTYNAIPINKDSIIHIKLPNILSISHWGLSPLNAAIGTYTASNNVIEAEAHLHKNRGVIGILSSKDSQLAMLPGEQKSVQDSFDERTTGPDKFGKTLVTSVALQYSQMAMSPTDLKTIESGVDKLRTICSIYGVNSSLFNDSKNKIFSDNELAEESFYTMAVLPLAKKIDTQLSKDILKSDFGINAIIEVDTTKIKALNITNKVQSDKVVSEVNAGILTAEEAKEILYPEL